MYIFKKIIYFQMKFSKIQKNSKKWIYEKFFKINNIRSNSFKNIREMWIFLKYINLKLK